MTDKQHRDDLQTTYMVSHLIKTLSVRATVLTCVDIELLSFDV